MAATLGRTALLAADVQAEVETLLAAHFYQLGDPGYKSRSTAGASGAFQTGGDGPQLGRTRYGQDAMLMDVSGALAAINKRAFAGSMWLGKPPSSQISYDERD